MERRDLIVRDLDPLATVWPTPGDGEWPNIRTRFPHGTRVVRGQGIFQDEIWMLVGDECTEDWNYWIVLVSDEHFGGWVIRATVPWWGPCEDWRENA